MATLRKDVEAEVDVPADSSDEAKVHTAGQLLIHLASTNIFEAERRLFATEQALLEESFSVGSSGPFRSYHIKAIRISLENENLELTERLLDKDSAGDILRDEVDLLPVAISGAKHKVDFAVTDKKQFERECTSRRERDASHISSIVRKLLSHGAPLNGLNNKGRSPLWFACFSGLPQTFELLVTSGADIQALHDPISKISLNDNEAASNFCTGKVNLLQVALNSRFNLESFDHGFEPWGYDFLGGDVLVNLKKSLKSFDHIIFSLLDAGLTCPKLDPSFIKLFHESCFEGNIAHVKSLLQYGVDVNAVDDRVCQDRYGTALHTAATRGYKKIVELLLVNGADPTLKRRVGKTILANETDLADQKSLMSPMTPISYALFQLDKFPIPQFFPRLDSILGCCEAILDSGASDRDGEVFLCQAIVLGNMTIAQRLLQRDIRRIYVFTLDQSCIERFVESGISFDYHIYQMWVISMAKSGVGWQSGLLAPVLDYLVQKSKPLLPKEIIGEIAVSMLRYKDVLRHIIKHYDIDVNTLFKINHDYDDSLHKEYQLRDLSALKEGAPFNLLQRACSEITQKNFQDMCDAIQLLLDEGASVDCPGLPKTALEYLRETIQPLHAPTDLPVRVSIEERFSCAVARILRLLLVGDPSNAKSTCSENIARRSLRELLQLDQSFLNRILELRPGTVTANTQIDASLDDTFHGSSPSNKQEQSIPEVDSPFEHIGFHLNSILPRLSPFEYHPLDDLQSVRLLALAPAESFEIPIRCQIFETKLATARFEALSYVWGKCTDLVPISLNGCVMNITQSLWCVLCRLRDSKTSRLLWVDALCINQEDVPEKGQQVQMMREIYIVAEQVLIWLGEADIESDRAFQTIREHQATPDSSAKSAIDIICSKRWFYRTWTLQELVLSRKASIMLGSQVLAWDEMRHFIKPEFRWQDELQLEIRSRPYSAVTGVSKIGHWRALMSLISYGSQRRGLIDTLYFVIKYAAVCQATDPRDKVYGLLGLFERPLLSVNYMLSPRQIYQQFTEVLITESGSLHILHMFGVQKRIDNLPSWVPDYSIHRPVSTLPAAYCGIREGYHDQIAMLQRRGQPWVSFRDQCLVTKGKRLCRIKAVGETLPANSALSPGNPEFALVLKGWEEIALGVDASRSRFTILEAFMRAITAYEEDERLEELDSLDFIWALCWYRKYGSNMLHNPDDKRIQELQDRLDLVTWIMPEEDCIRNAEKSINKISKMVEDVCPERRFFISGDGNIGLAPAASQPGDAIVMFQSGLYPFVVRSQEEGMSTLIGDAFHLDIVEEFRDETNGSVSKEEDEGTEKDKEAISEESGTNLDLGEQSDSREGGEGDSSRLFQEVDDDWADKWMKAEETEAKESFNEVFVFR